MAKYGQGGGCGCGLYSECVCGAEGVFSPLYKEPKTYRNYRISIPNIGSAKPDQYQMVLKVSEAIEINDDFVKLQKENIRMKAALREIMDSSEIGSTVRIALRGLGFDE